MKTKSINQSATFEATPQRIYELLTDQSELSAYTGQKAIISQEPNGKFSMFDGYCKGYNIELKKGKKIVQAWNFKEDGWPEDYYTTCTFLLEKDGNKTRLKFQQEGVPEKNVESLKGGWKEFFWDAIKKYLKKSE